MVSTQEVIDAIIHALESSDFVTDRANYIDHDPDTSSEAIKLPVIQVSPVIKTRISDENSDFIGTTSGDSENTARKVYEVLYRLEIMIAAWTAEGSQFAGRELSEAITKELFRYETSGMSNPLKKSDGSEIEDVWRFEVESGEQNDDLSTTPTLRRWEKSISVSMSETFESEDFPVVTDYTTDEQLQQ